jgi:catechol 2,3-dioxygenase-like lactoylglutathione lyase family enzyme
MFEKLDCVCVHTENLPLSLEFYAAMGLREAWRLDRLDNGRPWTLVGLDFPRGGAQLVLSTHPDRKLVEIEIQVPDVRAAYERLSLDPRIRWFAEPFPTEVGHVAVMEAPDGNTFVLIGK